MRMDPAETGLGAAPTIGQEVCVPKYTFLVLTNAADSQDEAFNAWYDNTHIPDVLRVPGFVAAQRFKLADTTPPQAFGHRYLALYELETDDLEGSRQALADAAGTSAMVLDPTLDRPGAVAAYFEELTERAVARPGPASGSVANGGASARTT